ncbi:MAG: cell division protein FtsX [Candidatus Marinarcus sp.]|uniref:cell division protein FtsX n=1 Tax=Candidatus Marinarcus sp. TaxID=3100987 RepID=UPI003AFFE957
MKSARKFFSCMRNIVSFIIPLSIMLITFSMYMFTTEIIDNYKTKISDDYSIVVITNTPLIKDDINSLAGIKVKKIVTLDKSQIINKVKDSLSENSIFLLKQRLPYFYTINLDTFPTTTQLDTIKEELSKIPNVKKIEIFSKDHNKIFSLLVLNQKTIITFFVISLIFSIILFSKQIQLWFFEHHEKIAIMQLHGASIIYSASVVIRDAIISALIAFFIVSGLLYFVFNNLTLVFPPELNSIIDIHPTLDKEILSLFVLSMVISITTIIGVLFKYKLTK